MTENHDLAPEADVTDQQLPVTDSADHPVEPSVPMEADPADAADQATPVPHDEDDEFRPGT
ncbi:hypothetical protein ACWGRK_09760 [Saccharomonospora azurea]|uniref:Uncharacterized protein n=1 Tax=Saccharomonospora azurea NA-128 TaxID=882081 RepID=H8GE96_9PSEU|nr:hypothetical protein [Saccharomonospora azurea]EHK86050.1 hypothetical protein SZMC14600_15120 [Saccharomonospora azurea SZMC 14600]EHY90978.1 hypothetical protein SacazDRAFT_04128 [Saccharomonospora azurea NA-128]